MCAFAATTRRLSGVVSRPSAANRTAGGVARTQASIGTSQTTATTTRTAHISAARRTASSYSTATCVNSNSSFRTAVGRATLRQVRTAIGNETSSLRYVGYMLDGGAEPNLLRGWDEGIVDAEGDDGT